MVPAAWYEVGAAEDGVGLRSREGRLTNEDWAERVFSTNLVRKSGSTRVFGGWDGS